MAKISNTRIAAELGRTLFFKGRRAQKIEVKKRRSSEPKKGLEKIETAKRGNSGTE